MSGNVQKNSNIELLLGDHKKAIRKLAWPMMVSMFLIMAYNLVDSIWVAGLGADALAAIGFINPLYMILIGLGNGIGAGANSMIARFIGADDYDGANNSALHSLVLTIIISIFGGVLICFMLPMILEAMGAGSATGAALEYGYIVFGCMLVFIYSNVATAILRSEGDVKRAMYSMAITAILNIILDPIMIYVLNMGISGAGWASVISALISCVVLLYWLHFENKMYLDINFKNFKYNSGIFKGILGVAIPSTSENIIISILNMISNWLLVITAGTVAVATYTAAFRVILLANIPIMGLGTALITVSGAAFGARNYEKLKNAFIYTLKLGVMISTVMIAIVYIFAPQVSMLFAYNSSSALAPQISETLRIMIVFVYCMCLGSVASMMFQGVGRGSVALILTVIRALILESIFSILFALTFAWGAYGVYYGVVTGGMIGGLICVGCAMFYFRGLLKSSTTS